MPMNPYSEGDYVSVTPVSGRRRYYGTVIEVSGDGLTIRSNENIIIQSPYWYVYPARRRSAT
jgi:hypothetical protein